MTHENERTERDSMAKQKVSRPASKAAAKSVKKSAVATKKSPVVKKVVKRGADPATKVVTPIANGTFLSGITRARVISLLAMEGIAVEERTVMPAELEAAAEIFNTGNFGKVMPCIRYESRTLPVGPIATLARDLYWKFAAQPASE